MNETNALTDEQVQELHAWCVKHNYYLLVLTDAHPANGIVAVQPGNKETGNPGLVKVIQDVQIVPNE